jgi:adhesin/invasin
MLATLTTIVTAQLDTSAAQAAEVVTFTVNSTALIAPDPSCDGAGGECTLREALESANAVPPGADVLINVDERVEGNIPFPTSSDVEPLMYKGTTAGLDADGAVFWADRPMTIDLGGRLHLVPGASASTAAFDLVTGIFVDAENVHLKNFTNWFSSATAIMFSGASSGSSLDGGSSIQTANNHTDRQIAIWAPASDLTISNYIMGRQNNPDYDGSIVIEGTAAKRSLANITISNVTFDNSLDSSTCSSSDGRGCSAHGINLQAGASLDGLVVENCSFVNFTGSRVPIDASSGGDQSNWDIRGNTFKDIRVSDSVGPTGEGYAAVRLPTDETFSGSSYIRDNVFNNSSPASQGKQGLAIYWNGAVSSLTSTTPSTVFIEDNYFDGYLMPVRIYQTGTLTVRRNTFGPASGSQSDPKDEEAGGTSTWAKFMFNNWDATANRNIRTWHPQSATITDCVLQVKVEPPTSGTAPSTPVTLDFYWTAANQAEEYLGSVHNLTSATTVALEQLPRSAGHIRLQTQGRGATDAQAESSQYSRTVPVAAPPTCQPALEIDLRGWAEVPSGATSHDQILASGAIELDDAVSVTSGTPLWFTYTVRNTGGVVLREVLVRDSQQNPVCQIEVIPIGATAGCARQTVAWESGE